MPPDGSICIHYNNYIWIHCFNTHIIIKMKCKRRVQIQGLQGIFTACSKRSRRPHSELSNTLCKRQAAAFVLKMLEINAAAWRSMRLHSVFTAIHSVPGDCSARTSAICNFLERCWNALRTPLWFARAFCSNVYYEASQLSHIAPRIKNPVIKIKNFQSSK